MNQESSGRWQARLAQTASRFEYPPTPDIAGVVKVEWSGAARRGLPVRRMALALAVLSILLGGLLIAVPQARATLVEVIRFGAVRVFLGPATPTTVVATSPSVSPGISPSVFPTQPAIDFGGETTLEGVRRRAPFPVRLPAYPTELGEPDRTFFQEVFGSPVVILVWLDPGNPSAARMSLHALGEGAAVAKVQPQVIERVEVNAEPALWTQGPYFVYVEAGGLEDRRLVEGNVLIWTEDEITYRLESSLPLDQAIRVAESLR